MKYIIRADYYSDGNIIPIGITNERGDSYSIRNTESRININTGEREYYCIVEGKRIILAFSKQQWTVREVQ